MTIVIFMFTCQPFSPDFAPGLDASYMWGLNWLFAHDYGTLRQLIYPIGPLALLKMPTYEGCNLLVSIIFYLLVKCGFIIMGFKAAGVIGAHNSVPSHDTFAKWIVPGIFIMVFSYFANIDVLIIFTCLLLCLDSIREQHLWPFLTACMLASLSLFIKISIGVSALSVVALSIALHHFEHRDFKKTMLYVGSLVGTLIVFSIIILHHPRTIINWYAGALHLIFGYGSLCIAYDNHKICLLLFILSTLAAPFVCREKNARHAFLMLSIPLFAFWKHGIIREDFYHYFGMVYFMVCFWMVLSLLETQRTQYILLLAAIAVSSLVFNAKEMYGFEKKSVVTYCGVPNAIEPYFHYKKFVRESKEITEQALQMQQLPDTIIRSIGTSSVDIYPFEFTYAAQNRLNWQPRTALGSALNPWLEAQSAKNFSTGKDAARFILWHFQDDAYGNASVTIDDHYFLNEEPEVVKNIINNYNVAVLGNHMILMSHTSTPTLGESTLSESFKAKWGEWVNIPQTESAIVRIKAQSHHNFLGKVIGFLYKDIIYSIEYETTDGKRYLYRYDPIFATEGLWVNPFVQLPYNLVPEKKVARVRFLASNTNRVKASLILQFEEIKLTGKRAFFPNKSHPLPTAP